MARECVICMTDEDDNTALLQLPCGSHSVCPPGEESDCLASFFRQATNEERLYPARCCDAVLFIDDYADLPGDLLWAYQVKEREYSVPAKLRVYCVDPSCNNFLHPNTYEKNAEVTFAKCESCSTVTCTTCKTTLLVTAELEHCENEVFKLEDGELSIKRCQNEENKRCEKCQVVIVTALMEHKCEIPEIEKKFRLTAKEKGYQECQGCGSTVELAEACNHITCECGHEFCYRCGHDWEGSCSFGCPLYGAPEYDQEGYNHDGFHRDTGRNRDGLTRAELLRQNNGEISDNESDQGEEEEDDELAGLDPQAREILAVLDPEDRAQALEMIRIQQVENGDIVFREEENPDENASDVAENEDAQENENEDQDEEQNEGAVPGGDMGVAALYNTADEDDASSDSSNSDTDEVDEIYHRMPGGFGDENQVANPSMLLGEALDFDLSINDDESDEEDSHVEAGVNSDSPDGHVLIGTDPFNVDVYDPAVHFPPGLNLAQYSELRSTINEQDQAHSSFLATTETTSKDEAEPMDIDQRGW